MQCNSGQVRQGVWKKNPAALSVQLLNEGSQVSIHTIYILYAEWVKTQKQVVVGGLSCLLAATLFLKGQTKYIYVVYMYIYNYICSHVYTFTHIYKYIYTFVFYIGHTYLSYSLLSNRKSFSAAKSLRLCARLCVPIQIQYMYTPLPAGMSIDVFEIRIFIYIYIYL